MTLDGQFIVGATGTGGSYTYTSQTSDADHLINVLAGSLVHSAALVPNVDTTAIISFYGSFTNGSTLRAQALSGATGTITINRADGSAAAAATGVGLLTYVLSGADLTNGPFTATLSSLVLTIPISGSAGTVLNNPFVTVEADMAGSTTAAGDVFKVFMAGGVKAYIDFASNGTKVTSDGALLNSVAYSAVSSDVGNAITAIISGITFTTGGVFGTPVQPSATTAPMLYGLNISQNARSTIVVSYVSLNNLDPNHIPPASAFSLGGTIKTAKTITSVALDNSSPDVKNLLLTVSSPFQPNDVPLLSYTGTDTRYPGGASAATFSGLTIFTDIPPYATLMYPRVYSPVRATASAPGNILFSTTTSVIQLEFTSTDSYDQLVSTQDCSVQMSILADWSDVNTIRTVGLNPQPNTSGGWNYEPWNLRRNGNSVQLYQQSAGHGPYDASVPVGPPYVFTTPGASCLARLRQDVTDYLMRFEVSLDGGDNWTLVATSTVASSAETGVQATAFCGSTTIPITGVATNGFD